MKRTTVRILAVLLALALSLGLAACGGGGDVQSTKAVDVQKLMEKLLSDVRYASELSMLEGNAELFFPDLPEATVTMYDGSGYDADELALITVTSEEDVEAAVVSAQEHIQELRAQFLSYIPEEVAKIDKAVIWNQGKYVIVCVTEDYATAESILANPPVVGEGAGDATEPSAEDTTNDSTEDPTEPPTEEVTEPPTEPVTEPPYAYIYSKSGTYKNYNGVLLIDNMAYEGYSYSESAAKNYAKLVNKVASDLEGKVNVYDLVIPTAIGVVFPDDMKSKVSLEDQSARLEQIFGMMNDSVIPVNCFDRLLAHRDEYLYFRTDWHWNGPGAYYAYEEFCQVKGITPYTMEQRQVKEFGNYLGGLYQNNCKKDPALKATPDTVVAYLPYSPNATMKYTDTNGRTYAWDIIKDVSDWNAASKYNCFAASDQPYAEFTNPDVTDGSVLVIVKESFGNALLSYLVDHYSTIYEIDYRYWSGDLAAFCEKVGADDLLFANNIGMVRTSYLIGKLDNIIS